MQITTRAAVSILAFQLTLGLSVSLAQDSRLAIPDRAAQQRVMQLLKDVYEADYAKAKTATTRLTLARKMLAEGAKSADPVNRFVMLGEAKRLATEAENVETAMLAIDEVGKRYRVDPVAVKASTLWALAKATESPTRHKAIARAAGALMDEAGAADRHDMAVKLADFAIASARKGRDGDLIKDIATKKQEAQEKQAAFKAVQAALATLDTKPADPHANLVVGGYQCFIKNDWAKGLPMLALGADPKLSPLAEAELRGITTPQAKVAQADAWWAAAETLPTSQKANTRRHAARWYRQALPHLTELLKKRVEKRLAEAGDTGETPAVVTSKEPPKPTKLAKQFTLALGNGVKMEFLLIPAGSFMMGDANGAEHEKPVHKVTITKPFYLGKHEVTQTQWKAVMGNDPSRNKGPTNPVEQVSWNDCQSFLAKLDQRFRETGMEFRLPTESQWEYACRAGTTTAFSFGNNKEAIFEYAWFHSNSGDTTHPVGQKKPNAWGLFDMPGNVCEWCSDWYATDYYGRSPGTDPVGPGVGSVRVNRGGTVIGPANECKPASRADREPSCRHPRIGFRVMCRPSSEAKTAAGKVAFPKGKWVDLTKDVATRSVYKEGGDWIVENGRIAVRSHKGMSKYIFEIPSEMLENGFETEFMLESISADNEGFYVPIGNTGHTTLVVFGHNPSGLDRIGQKRFNENETTIKNARPLPGAKIRISCKPEGDQWRVIVKANNRVMIDCTKPANQYDLDPGWNRGLNQPSDRAAPKRTGFIGHGKGVSSYLKPMLKAL